MNQNPKRSISEYLVGAGLILVPCLGALMFVHEAGFSDTAILIVSIMGFIGLIAALFKVNPILGYYSFVLALILLVLYAVDMLWMLGIPVVILFYLVIYKIGERYGWWKQGSK